jgi:hypothetical protein
VGGEEHIHYQGYADGTISCTCMKTCTKHFTCRQLSTFHLCLTKAAYKNNLDISEESYP